MSNIRCYQQRTEHVGRRLLQQRDPLLEKTFHWTDACFRC